MRRPISLTGMLAITTALALAGSYIWFRSGARINTDVGQNGSPRSTPSTGIGPPMVTAPPWWVGMTGPPDGLSSSKSGLMFPPRDVTDMGITATVRAPDLLPSSKSIRLGLSDVLAGDPESTPSQTATATDTATPTPTP